MTVKMECSPNPAPVGVQVQVRASGLKRGKSHLLTATPPNGALEERIGISDEEGALAETFYTYAPGDWKFRLDLQREGAPDAECELVVQ